MRTASYRFTLFGEVTLSRADGSRIDVRAKKSLALLVHLVLHPRGEASRERLATLLWGELREGRARANLRQSLSTLRALLDDPQGSIVSNDHAAVRIESEAFDVDVDRFCRLARDPTQHDRALDSYGGELLPGFELGEDAFDEWLASERSRVAALASSLFERAVAAPARDHDRVEPLLLRWLALEPWREEAHRALMEIYARTGRRSKALHQFELCRQQLLRAYSVAPSEATIALQRSLRGVGPEPKKQAPDHVAS